MDAIIAVPGRRRGDIKSELQTVFRTGQELFAPILIVSTAQVLYINPQGVEITARIHGRKQPRIEIAIQIRFLHLWKSNSKTSLISFPCLPGFEVDDSRCAEMPGADRKDNNYFRLRPTDRAAGFCATSLYLLAKDRSVNLYPFRAMVQPDICCRPAADNLVRRKLAMARKLCWINMKKQIPSSRKSGTAE